MMSKFLSFSFLFHLTLLALMLSHFHFPIHPHEHNEYEKSYVTINLDKADLKPSKTKPRKTKKAPPKQKKDLLGENKTPKSTDASNQEVVSKDSTEKKSSRNPEKQAYKDELYSYIKNKRHYPPMAAKLRQEGSLRVQITILEDGRFENIKLLESSKHRTLNEGTLNFLNKMAKFKPLPDNKTKENFEVPIRYQL